MDPNLIDPNALNVISAAVSQTMATADVCRWLLLVCAFALSFIAGSLTWRLVVLGKNQRNWW
jgi:hypothetical protein